MKIISKTLWVILLPLICFAQNTFIRVNQLGYQNNAKKVAVLISKSDLKLSEFYVIDVLTNASVLKSTKIIKYSNWEGFKVCYRLDLSELKKTGRYYIKANNVSSPQFSINQSVYTGITDFLLQYMRQQRSGFNPYLKDSCHKHDGYIVYHPTKSGQKIDVSGGWHDASDYLQYVTTSANATYQMLFSYLKNSKIFGDNYLANGLKGKNGIADILDEAKWGLEWLIKMNPSDTEMYNQIADDRDHASYRLPTLDSVDYGWGKGKGRPVYFCTDKPQGLQKYKNRSNGLASTAGKFASTFAIGSRVMLKFDEKYANILKKKAIAAYELGIKYPGVCQTASCVSPYFYEEENYADDMELAAVELYNLTKDKRYLDDAVKFGHKEPVTPWMGADTARHYEWYPFINLGHYWIGKCNNKKYSSEFITNLKKGIDLVYNKGKNNPFQIGIPFIWCSNNLVSNFLMQCRLYNELTNDDKYLAMEASLRDWLMGCNPWGTTMVIGLPENGDSPSDPHSALSAVYKMPIPGGLVDGPVYSTIYKLLRGIKLCNADEYCEVQPNRMVYHDDNGDYSTNEPTMDGTASLTMYFSELESLAGSKKKVLSELGATVRGDTTSKEISLVFTGGDYSESTEKISKILKEKGIKASFFFTGDFLRNPINKVAIRNIINNGNYVGPHSDKHLLYAKWNKRDSTIITQKQFTDDINANILELSKFNIKRDNVKYFLPPYEWYNKDIAAWTNEMGIKLVNFTSGSFSNYDWTTEDMGKKYYSNDKILDCIKKFENENSNHMNGFILLLHVGSGDKRKEKFVEKMPELFDYLKRKGYKFVTLEKMIE